MRLTFYTETGYNYVVEIDPQMQLEDIMALLEAESGIPVADQSISINGRDLSDSRATMAGSGVTENSVLLLRRKVTVAGRTVEQDAEMIRLQILGDPNLLHELRETQPDVAAAAQNDPALFATLLHQQRARYTNAEQNIANMNSDPYDVEAQRKIEEAIRMEAVMENLEHAMEYSPEAFGRVTMLYIPVEVNGHPVKAFVDSGAQQTIVSPECAEECGIMRLLDTRFSGIAKGVGTANILGRVHSAQIKLADLHLPCAITVMEGRDVDLLFGLDMLKAHQACIDLGKNVLRIQGREVQFLSEHELPEKARDSNLHTSKGDRPLSSGSEVSPQSPATFPGPGKALGSTNSASGSQGRPSKQSTSQYPERDIETLMGLGVSREIAIQTLDASGGNVDIASKAVRTTVLALMSLLEVWVMILTAAVPLYLLKIIADRSPLTRYYFRLCLYVSALSVTSVWGVLVSVAMSIFGQGFNINYIVARSFYNLTGRLMSIQFEVEGEHYLDGKPSVLLGNHQSMLDILYLGRIFPRKASIMAKKELQWMPFLGQYMKLSGAVFVNRASNKDAIAALAAAGNKMKSRGISLWMFPEGTRHSAEEADMLPFKKGAFHLAVQAGVPIVPVVCENYWRLYHKGVLDSGKLKIVVLEPISTTGMTAAEVPDLVARVREIMLKTLRRISVDTSMSTAEVTIPGKSASAPALAPSHQQPTSPTHFSSQSGLPLTIDGSVTGTDTSEEDGVLVDRF